MTVSASALLDELVGRGVHLYLSDGRLRAIAAKDVMTSEVRQLIETHREDLTSALRDLDGKRRASDTTARGGVRLTTERLLIRPLRAGDEGDVLAYRGRADVYRFLKKEPLNASTVGRFVAEEASATRMDRDDDGILLAVELGGTVVGDVALHRGRLADAQGEIGWVFNPDYHGQGYATEATRAVVRYGFEDLRLHRVWARLDPRNTASVRLCERIGMRQEAHLKEECWSDGQWADVVIYALLDREWRQPPAR